MQITEDVFCAKLAAGAFYPPAGCINNTAVAAGAAGAYITATKSGQRRVVVIELFESTTDCAALTKIIGAVHGATGTLVEFSAAVVTKATTDKTATIDLKKSTGGGAFASVLSAVITKSTSDTNLVFETASFSSTSLVTGDILEAVVAVTAGTGGNQNKGLVVKLVFDEDPQ